MALALLAMAACAAAASVDEDQTGGQDGRLGVQLFEPGEEVAADEGGMFGNFQAWAKAWASHIAIGYVILLIRYGKKNRSCEERFLGSLPTVGANARCPLSAGDPARNPKCEN